MINDYIGAFCSNINHKNGLFGKTYGFLIKHAFLMTETHYWGFLGNQSLSKASGRTDFAGTEL